MKRPDWPEYFMHIAEVVATRSEDPKTRVGSVLVKNNRIVSTGYNGTVSGFNGVDWETNAKHLHVLHSELNAIVYADREEAKGATLYCTHSPCAECAKVIAAAGIKNVCYRNLYKNGLGLQILEDFNIQTEQV